MNATRQRSSWVATATTVNRVPCCCSYTAVRVRHAGAEGMRGGRGKGGAVGARLAVPPPPTNAPGGGLTARRLAVVCSAAPGRPYAYTQDI